MTRYGALVDGKAGAYGVAFPDLPGCVAMGRTVDDAIVNAEEALREYADDVNGRGGTLPPPSPLEAIETPSGTQLVSIALIRSSGRRVRMNVYVDEDVASFIDEEARRRGITRTACLSWMVRRVAQMGGMR